MSSASKNNYATTVSAAPQPARDLIEFFWRWQEFRQVAVNIPGLAGLSENERVTVDWMIALIDRIGEHDLDAAEYTASLRPPDHGSHLPRQFATARETLAGGTDEEKARHHD